MLVAEAQKNHSLYSLQSEYRQLMTAFEASGGEMDETLESAVQVVEAALLRKVDSYAFVMNKLGAESDFYRAQAKLYIAYADACDALRSRLESRLTEALKEAPGGRLDGETAAYALRNNPASVKITGEIPDAYLRTVVTSQPDKAKIKEDLKAGVAVPGAELVTTQRAVLVKPNK